MIAPQAAHTDAGAAVRSRIHSKAFMFSRCSSGFSVFSMSSGIVARWAYTLNMINESYPLPSAMRWALFSVLSSRSGAAVDGLIPMQISGRLPFVPRI